MIKEDIKLSLTDFLKKLPPVVLVGVMGLCGKRSVSSAIEKIFTDARKSYGGKFFFIDLERDDLFIEYLKFITRDSVVLTVIPNHLLRYIKEVGIVPTISVFTCLESVEDYKFIFEKLTYTNYIIGTDEVIDLIRKENKNPIKGKLLRTGINILPKGARLSDLPYHIRENVSLAVRVAEIFEIPHTAVVDSISTFKGLDGRLQYIKKIKEVAYINDAYSEHFASLLVAVSSVANYKNAVLIIGGNGYESNSEDKIDKIAQYCHTMIFLPGSGTQKLYKHIFKRDDLVLEYCENIEDAVMKSHDGAGKGDVVIFSPGFCPTRLHKNSAERSDEFIKAVHKL